MRVNVKHSPCQKMAFRIPILATANSSITAFGKTDTDKLALLNRVTQIEMTVPVLRFESLAVAPQDIQRQLQGKVFLEKPTMRICPEGLLGKFLVFF